MKVMHLHLEDSMKNPSTLVCRLEGGSLRWSLYGGHGSSGMAYSLANIQYYDLINGSIFWNRDRALPIETLEDETLPSFRMRVLKMLKYSTLTVVKEVNINVTFKAEPAC